MPTLSLFAESDEITPNPMTPLISDPTSTLESLIPQPVSIEPGEGAFILTPESAIRWNDRRLQPEAEYLAAQLRPATGYPIQTSVAPSLLVPGTIYLSLERDDLGLGEEGYELEINTMWIALRANQPAGIFYGIQTLRQLFPPSIELDTPQKPLWTVPSATIRDYPRFGWRGAMLDVARHFFPVETVKQYLDWMAYYKLNRLHLHLSDDQGWRIMIHSWENLALYGGSTAVDGAPGGYFTQADYTEIVKYAQERYITIVPEIDMPGHTNAALASYPELNCDGKAPALYTGTRVGFSSLCVTKEITYTFVEDVIREIAAITPGEYIHIGGDESQATPDDEYILFMERVQPIVNKYGKKVIGWEEIAQSRLVPGVLVQHWNSDLALKGVAQGAKVIMSPSSKAYLDMKYTRDTALGLDWAGLIEVRTAYEWDPAVQLRGLKEADIVGVEAPLWAETLTTLDEIAFMAFPRLAGFAEMGWSPAEVREWETYQVRLKAHYPRFEALGINFYRSPQVP